MPKMDPPLFSSPVIHRYQNGAPVLSKANVPYPADCVFNAGVAKFQGKYIMVFRDDFGNTGGGHFAGTYVGVAYSNDGLTWSVRNTPFLTPESLGDPDVIRVYDPRLTVMDGRCYLCFAVDTRHGLRGGIAVSAFPFRTRQPQHGSVSRKNRRALRPAGTAHAGLFPMGEKPV